MATISEITLEQLASVDAKMLFKALEMRLASAGILKKRASKVAKVSSADSDDAASVSSAPRSVGEGTKKWNDLTRTVAALVKTTLAGEKGGAGFHLKVLSYLKTEMSLESDTEPTADQVAKAVSYLKKNPEWESPNKKAKTAKIAEAPKLSVKTTEEPVKPTINVVIKSSPKPTAEAESEPKKKGRPAKSAEEKEATLVAKKAIKDAEVAAKKAEKKAEKTVKVATPAPAPAEEEENDSSDDNVTIELEGVEYIWNSSTGVVFDCIDGSLGERVGTWDGTGAEITKDE